MLVTGLIVLSALGLGGLGGSILNNKTEPSTIINAPENSVMSGMSLPVKLVLYSGLIITVIYVGKKVIKKA